MTGRGTIRRVGALILLACSVLACNLARNLPAGDASVLRPEGGYTPRATASPLPPALGTPFRTRPPATMGAPATPTLPPITPTLSPTATQTVVRVSTTQGSAETRGMVTVETTTITTHYVIGGFSEAEIDAQMRTYGPTDALSGGHWYALTEPAFDWRVPPTCADQGCAAESVLMLLTIRLTLPRWSPGGAVDQALADQWAAFDAALVAHEGGHADLAAACAWQLGEAFAVLPPAGSAQAFEGSVRAASDPIFAACREAQRAYENETNHGATQGVIWGP